VKEMGGFSLYSFLANFLSSANCTFILFVFDDTFCCFTLEIFLTFIRLNERKLLSQSRSYTFNIQTLHGTVEFFRPSDAILLSTAIMKAGFSEIRDTITLRRSQNSCFMVNNAQIQF
jgi:hypothetical protein